MGPWLLLAAWVPCWARRCCWLLGCGRPDYPDAAGMRSKFSLQLGRVFPGRPASLNSKRMGNDVYGGSEMPKDSMALFGTGAATHSLTHSLTHLRTHSCPW